MTNTSREAFEAWYHPNFFTDPKTLAWEAWKAGREAALEEAALFIENGSFLHDQSPAKLFADQLAPKIRSLK